MPNLTTYYEARQILDELRLISGRLASDLAAVAAGESESITMTDIIGGLSQDEFTAVAAESRPTGLSPL